MTDTYDYIVIGGGSAGCIVAAELARDGARRILLLESGPPAEAHPETLVAAGYKEAFINDAVMGERFSVPQEHAAKRITRQSKRRSDPTDGRRRDGPRPASSRRKSTVSNERTTSTTVT